ncbi:MAG: riboflavin synthase [Magnetococcus sp. DMHC-6]
MFTGLIEDIGTIGGIRKSTLDWRLEVRCPWEMSSVRMGDSIAVNGACLTVVESVEKTGASSFSVEVSSETVQRTTFTTLVPGSVVNLERALQVGGRLDGHIVQGHVDAIGRVERVSPRGRSNEIWFRVPVLAGKYIVSKGSIAIDGVSLTVNEVEDNGEITRFSVNIIPHTQKKTTLTGLVPGREVNIETDLLGRYVERLLSRGGLGCSSSSHKMGTVYKGSGGLDERTLREKGFI